MLPQALFLLLAALLASPMQVVGTVPTRHVVPFAQHISLPAIPGSSPRIQKRAMNETKMGIMSATLASDRQSYYSIIEVGGMNFRVALDTASSDLWLASSACTTETCNAIPRYPLSYESPSFASVNGNQTAFNASYADGTSSNGFIARERVTLANLTIPDQTLGIITVSNVTLTDRTTGLLGLGFPRLSGVNQTVTNSTPFLVNLAQRGLLEYPLFGLHLTRNTSGAIDAAVVMQPANISWNPVVQFTPFASESNVSSYLQWAIPLGGFSVNHTQLAPMPTYTNVTNNMSIALIDIGTPGLYGPFQDVSRLFSLIDGARLVDSSGQWAIPCDTSVPISFTFGGVSYDLQPYEYIIGPAAGNPNLCLSWPMAAPLSSDGIDWQIGANFLRSVYSIFSYGINRKEPPMIGFYSLRNQTAALSPVDAVSSMLQFISGISTVATTLPNFPLPTPTFTTPPYAFNTSVSTSNGGIVFSGLATSTYRPVLGGPNGVNASAIPTISPKPVLQTLILTNAQGLLTTSTKTLEEPTVTLALPPGWNAASHPQIDIFAMLFMFALSCTWLVL
ncbi:acid protease [Pleurotus eryngii]|uniref:Acid protease n=1 Tax=Pleurotus eryngii TaxID=5323 RepID=A0A9P6A6S1_PLEER|nr:acid protease [Pleurotus eryngii]